MASTVKQSSASRTALHQGSNSISSFIGVAEEEITKFKSKARSQFKAKARLELSTGASFRFGSEYKSKYKDKGRERTRYKPTDISVPRRTSCSMYILSPMNSSAPNANRARNFLTKLTLNGARDSDLNFFLSANSLLPFKSRPDRKNPTYPGKSLSPRFSSKAGPLDRV